MSNFQNNWLFRQLKTAINFYRAKRQVKKNAELRLKEIQNAYLRNFIHFKLEQYKKDNNIIE